MTTEQIIFEPSLLEALNKDLMRIVGASNEDSYSSEMLTPDEKDSLAAAAVAYKASNYYVAATNYRTCMSLINKNHTGDNELSNHDVILQYMLCKCLIHSQQFQDLIEARTMLTELETSVGKIYPMIYYGLAELYVKIFCFDEAEQFITKGFAIMKEDMKFPECYIPETSDLISESTKQDLTEKLLSLREQCSGWHPPDAKCFMDNCSTVSPTHLCGRNIFIKSPAFSGMVTLTCSNTMNPCTITFHSVCWKIKKDEVLSGMKIPDKDIILNWLCLTPNCGEEDKPSVIRKIKILKEDGSFKDIEAPVEKFSRNTQQQNSVSKGAIRKQKLMNKTSTPKVSKIKSVLSNNNNSIHVTNNNHSHQNSNVKNNSWANEVLKETSKHQELQNPPSLVNPVTIKLMKMISLRESNFNIEFEDDWRPDQAYYGNEHMRSTIDSCYEPEFSNDPEHVTHIKSFLFSYFFTYIENRGPIKNDELLNEWLSITESIGGCETIVNDLNSIIDVRQFLLQSLKFVSMDDYICIPVSLPKAYELVETEVNHKVTTSIAKGDSELHGKNERKKKEKQNSINESDTQVKEDTIVQEEPVEIADDKSSVNLLERNDTNAEDAFLLTPDDFLDISTSDQDNWTGSDNSSLVSCYTPIEVIEDGKNSEIIEGEAHMTEIQGKEVIQDDKVRERIFLTDDAGETMNETEDEDMKISGEKVDNDESEIKDSADGIKSGFTEHQTSDRPSEDGSFTVEEIIETEGACQREVLEIEDKNISEEPRVEEEGQQVETEEAIETNEITGVEVYETAERTLVQTINENFQENSKQNQNEFLEAHERYVIEDESREISSEQDDNVSTDEDTGTNDLSESLTPIKEEDSFAEAKSIYQGDDAEEQENDDTESSCSSTIDQVMNEFINMSSNKSQFLEKAPESAQPLDNNIIAEQAATIEQLTEELHNTQNELERTTKELENMKMHMLKKSLDGQYNSNNTFISCKMEAIRSDYAIVTKLQEIVFNTVGNYLNINWQDWTVPLENFEKVRSSLHDEYTKLARLISSKENCEDMDDVCLNILNVPPLPQHNIPKVIEVGFNMIKHRVQQSVVSCQPPALPLQNPHMTQMMSFWYQQIPFFRQPLPSTAPRHHLINPLVPSTQVQKVVAASAQYPPSTVTWMNSSPPATVESVSSTISHAMSQPSMKSTVIDANVNSLAWSNALKPCLRMGPPVNTASTTASWLSWTSMNTRKEATATKPVQAIRDSSPSPKSETEVCMQAFASELSNSSQSTLLTAQNNISLPKICTSTVFSEDVRFPSQSHVKIAPKDPASNETYIPSPAEKQKSMDANVKTAESIKTETHDRFSGENQSAKSHVEVTAQVIGSRAEVALQLQKEPVALKIETAIKKEVKKPLEKSAHKSKESSQVNVNASQKQSVKEKPQVSLSCAKDRVQSNQKKDSSDIVMVPVSDQAKTSMTIPLKCKNTSATSKTSVAVFSNDSSLTTSQLLPSTSSSKTSKCMPKSIKEEALRANDAPTAHSNGSIEKSAPIIKEKDLPKTIQEDNCNQMQLNQTGQLIINQQTPQNAAIEQSVKYEKPSTSSHTSITNSHTKVKTPEKAKMHSRDKLMYILRKKHIGVLEHDLVYSVETVRKNHNYTLSGLLFSQIVEEASQVINKRQKLQIVPYLPNNGPTSSKNECLYVTAKTERPRNDSISSTSSASSVHREFVTKMNPWIKPQDVCWTKNSPEVECVICMEVLITCTKEPTYTLKCQHTFHKQCIRDWFTKNQSTCPTCRKHSTIDDEFPPLP